MELVNASENFLSLRRSGRRTTAARRIKELTNHLKSQGGERALLRLGSREEVEIERTFLFRDQNRHAFVRDREGDVSELNLTVPFRSYVDSLILDAARRHQEQSGPNHQVLLLTSDQGLARMALGSAVIPLYFRATRAADVFGQRLTGRIYNPFTGELQPRSLALVLWELAVAFGSARIARDGTDVSFTVSAIGEELPWSLFHSQDDLLWVARCGDASAGGDGGVQSVDSELVREVGTVPGETDSDAIVTSLRGVTFFQFNAARLLWLVCFLDDNQSVAHADVGRELGTRNSKGLDEYRRLLLSGSFLTVEGDKWQATPSLQHLSAALRNERAEDVRDALCAVPSFQALAELIRATEVGRAVDLSRLRRGATNYRVLGQATLMCATIHGEGTYPTPNTPSAEDFAPVAVQRYADLVGDDGIVASGAWLESLIRNNGIHPEVARRRLDEASERGLLRRLTEGSTPQVRHGSHVVNVLRAREGYPEIERVRLYRGDYLIPGKASVSLRIEDKTQ